jgi:hypothetical protein
MKIKQFTGWDDLAEWEPIRGAAGSSQRVEPIRTDKDRGPPSERDQRLSPLAKTWAQALPPEAKAGFLCAHFPRIVNRLAMCWPDPPLALKLMHEFFVNKRGGARRGFPPEALSELKRLHVLAVQRSKGKP